MRGLEERVQGFLKKEARLKAAVAAAEGCEEDLEQCNVRDMEEINVLGQDKQDDTQASVDLSTGSVEESSWRAESIGAELTATKFETRPLEALASRMRSEVEGCKSSLGGSEDSKKTLVEKMEMLDAEWKERARMLETELEISRVTLDGNGGTAGEVGKTREKECDLDNLTARLNRAEIEATASTAEKSKIEEAFVEEKNSRGKLELELTCTREALLDTTRHGASLEGKLVESQDMNRRLEKELDNARSQIASFDISREKLEASISSKADSIIDLQQRLGDALAEGVEYANQAIISEERLRSIEADCTTIWREREEATGQLREAQLEGRELASKIEKYADDTAQLREALQKTEFRLTSAMRDNEELEEELAASRDHYALSSKELERTRDMHADACSENRLLKASGEESRAEISRLKKELARATKPGPGEAGTKRENFWLKLALNQKQEGSAKKEPRDAHAQVGVEAGNCVALAAKLRKAESVAEGLRLTLEATEMRMSEVQADAHRSKFDLEETLRKCTELQERLGETDNQLKSEASDRQRAEEALSQSVTRVADLGQALQEAELQRTSVAAGKEKLDGRLKEIAEENDGLRELVVACEDTVQDLKNSLSEALAYRDSSVARIARLEADVDECATLRETGMAVVERALKSAVMMRALEARIGELTSEAEILRRTVAAKDAELEDARARLEEADRRLKGSTDRLEETTARLQTANAYVEEQKRKTVEYEAEGSRLMEVLDEIEADFAAGKKTTADLKQDLADLHEIGLFLAEKLTAEVAEKNKITDKLDVAEAALAASAAHRRHLERELEVREVAREGLANEADGLREVCAMYCMGD